MREEVVARLAAARMRPRDVDETANVFAATAEELAAADRIVSAEQLRHLEDIGQVMRAPNLLDMSLHDVRRLAWQGVALTRLLDVVEPRWGPYPDRSLSSVLTTEPRQLLEWLATMLHAHGITDLDDHLPGGRPGS